MKSVPALSFVAFALAACQTAEPGHYRAIADQLAAVIERDTHITEPTANVLTRRVGESLFDGSYDWHSNMFAHWALLTHARTTGDRALAARILGRLTQEALGQERKRVAALDSDRLVTFPYDQSWLLALLAELARHRRPTATELAFRLEVETRIVDWLETSRFPENDDPERIDGRRVVGWYRSWLLAWYQVRRSEPIGEGTVARLMALHETRIVPHLQLVLEPSRPLRMEFLWKPTLAWLVHDVAPFPDFPVQYELGEPPPLPESVKLSTTHALGVHVSRLWPLAICARHNPAARDELDRRLAHYLRREDLWDGDFKVVSHWVPQMLWFTLYLANEV